MVKPEIMCRKHLLGEHVETHMFVGSILKGKSLKGFIEKGLVEMDKIRCRHDELANEMKNRGYKHNSIMDFNTSRPEGRIDAAQNLLELARRCPECRKLQEVV